jgi:hypothetical protein
VAPRLLPIFRLYYRGGPGYLPQMRYFSQRGLCHDKGEGNVGSSVWRSSIGRGEENPLLLMYIHRGGIVQYKEASARALLPPPKPGAGFSVRHPSKDVEHSQPRTFAEFFFHALR